MNRKQQIDREVTASQSLAQALQAPAKPRPPRRYDLPVYKRPLGTNLGEALAAAKVGKGQ